MPSSYVNWIGPGVNHRGGYGFRIELDRLIVIGDGAIEIVLGPGLAPAKESRRRFRLRRDGPVIIGDSAVVLAP